MKKEEGKWETPTERVSHPAPGPGEAGWSQGCLDRFVKIIMARIVKIYRPPDEKGGRKMGDTYWASVAPGAGSRRGRVESRMSGPICKNHYGPDRQNLATSG